MEFSEVVRERYSCKSYESRQIEQEKLDQILEAGTPGSYCQEPAGTAHLRDTVRGRAGKD